MNINDDFGARLEAELKRRVSAHSYHESVPSSLLGSYDAVRAANAATPAPKARHGLGAHGYAPRHNCPTCYPAENSAPEYDNATIKARDGVGDKWNRAGASAWVELGKAVDTLNKESKR